MHNLINAFPLYNFLKYCNNSSLEKIILDCGAGGANPPLSLFYEFSYETYGVELCEDQLAKACDFSEVHNMDLNIIKGDMTILPFDNEFFSFLYSYNTTVHMRKHDFKKAIAEFHRVLKAGGLSYVNFLTEECETFGKGTQISEGEFKQTEDGEEVFYCHYKEEEIHQLFCNFDMLYKEKRIVERNIDNKIFKSAYLDYIIKKK
ncbi:class I SAM-dependent methyltransferase [Vallitalea okinawensis]|uniref:class I SAM-dependent methyltransferase n=1 Tax=Vallitalea okinawensis TaxID=2078660 RepID=UPI000CFBCDF1|nr:class I SAM-dependent methyltransferase [Vallitalea okinawensis]